MREIKTDVVLVDGGPAGSTAATLMAEDGHDVIQLEREHHPRHDIGESLTPATIDRVCGLLGVKEAAHGAGFVRKNGGLFLEPRALARVRRLQDELLAFHERLAVAARSATRAFALWNAFLRVWLL